MDDEEFPLSTEQISAILDSFPFGGQLIILSETGNTRGGGFIPNFGSAIALMVSCITATRVQGERNEDTLLVNLCNELLSSLRPHAPYVDLPIEFDLQ